MNNIININSHPKFKINEININSEQWYFDYINGLNEEELILHHEWSLKLKESLNGRNIEDIF